MFRNFIGFIVGALVSYALAILGWRLAWLLLVGNVDSTGNKGAIVTLMVVETAVIAPAVSVIVGAVVASIVVRTGWWVGGLAVLPIFIHAFIRGLFRTEIVLSVVCIALAFAAAFAVSRLKSRLYRIGHAQPEPPPASFSSS